MPRKARKPKDEPMTAFRWLVVTLILVEVVYLIYRDGGLSPL